MKTVADRMRTDWDRRARTDVRYFVALGRRNQSWQEFVESAGETVIVLERELHTWFDEGTRDRLRALEIGCGPGRLMCACHHNFGELHGVDISSEMVQLARQNLSGIPHAHAHLGTGSDLFGFESDHFDFVYSYAVFQHIPDAEVVLNYIREARRVLKPGAVACLHFNGRRKVVKCDTWSGVRHRKDEIVALARELDLQLVGLEGDGGPDMWATFVKPLAEWSNMTAPSNITLHEIVPADPSLPGVPVRGRHASFTVRVEGLSPNCDLKTLELSVGGQAATLTRIEPDKDGLRLVVANLPRGLDAGDHLVRLRLAGTPLVAQKAVRVIAKPQQDPLIVRVGDGQFPGSGEILFSRCVRVTLDEWDRPEDLQMKVNGKSAKWMRAFCSEPDYPRFEIDFRLPRGLRGRQQIECRLGSRLLGSFEIEVKTDRFLHWLLWHPVEIVQGVLRSRWIGKEIDSA